MSCSSVRADANMRSPGSSRNRRCCGKLYAAPGNPGIAEHAELVALDPADHRAVVDFCRRHGDRPRRDRPRGAAGRRPRRQSADDGHPRLRARTGSPPSSKARRASPRICARGTTSRPPATPAPRTGSRPRRRWSDFGLPVVIKADGLAAGKGVIVAETAAGGARRRSTRCSTAASASAGEAVVIEEFMDGEEVSFFALVDGETVAPVRLGPGPQARRRRRHRPQYRRHGRLQPRLDLHAGARSAGARRDRPPDRPGAGRGGHALFGHPLCRADADRRGAEAGRI